MTVFALIFPGTIIWCFSISPTKRLPIMTYCTLTIHVLWIYLSNKRTYQKPYIIWFFLLTFNVIWCCRMHFTGSDFVFRLTSVTNGFYRAVHSNFNYVNKINKSKTYFNVNTNSAKFFLRPFSQNWDPDIRLVNTLRSIIVWL